MYNKIGIRVLFLSISVKATRRLAASIPFYYSIV